MPPVGTMSQVRPFYFLERSLGKICQESDEKQSRVPEADLAFELDVEAADRFLGVCNGLQAFWFMNWSR